MGFANQSNNPNLAAKHLCGVFLEKKVFEVCNCEMGALSLSGGAWSELWLGKPKTAVMSSQTM